MNVIILSDSCEDGGAFIAAKRIHYALMHFDINSTMIVRDTRVNAENTVSVTKSKLDKALYVLKGYLSNLLVHIYKRNKCIPFSANHTGNRITDYPLIREADVIHLHWINNGFLSIRNIGALRRLNIPIVWTLHDMWPFTGGCHYAGACEKYTTACGACPALHSSKKRDLSRFIMNIKVKQYKKLNMTIVTPSNWLKDCVIKSRLFKDLPIQVIPYPININVFKPIEKMIAMNILNLSMKKKVILFGASDVNDKRKGFLYLIDALNLLKKSNNEYELLVFGKDNEDTKRKFPFKTHFIGVLKDEYSLSLCYNIADVFVAPSLEDNLPNTVIESLACATPVVAFNIGGMPDMIEHKGNGYLCSNISSASLAEGISFVLEDDERLDGLKCRARHNALMRYSPEVIAKEYSEVYHSVI